MKKSDLTDAIIGRKCVVYKPGQRIVGRIERIEKDSAMIVSGNYSAWWQHKNVHLLKKKEPKYLWVNKDIIGTFNCREKPSNDTFYIKVKVVK